MEIKAEKQRLARTTGALVLAAAIILGSVVTVTAATATDSSRETNQNSANAMKMDSKIQFELPNGDMLIGEDTGFDTSLNVFKARKITVDNCGEEITVMLAKGTVADVLNKARIEIDDSKIVVPSEESEITEDTKITISNAVNISVTADGESNEVSVSEGNVVDSLNSAGYDIDDNDVLSISRDSDVWDGMKVKIQRVTYKEETTTEKIKYDSVTKKSDKLALGKTKVQTEGEDGEKLITEKCKYVDGKKVSSEVVESKVVKEPVDEITLVGTAGTSSAGTSASGSSSGSAKATGTFTDQNGNVVEYSRVVTGSGTAYTASAGALTATGVAAYYGGVAVNPNVIPYGSKLYIESTDGSVVYGYATAVDTGGALMSGSAVVDCFYNTYAECVSFGRHNVNVYVLSC